MFLLCSVCFIILWSCLFLFFFFFKQKTAYEMRISDWSSDVCSSDLVTALEPEGEAWKALAEPDGSFRFCANAEHDACNWLIPADSPDAYCMACRQIGRASCRERVCQYV